MSINNISIDQIKSILLPKFLSYVKIWTTSNSDLADKGIQPSTERQFELAKLLSKELSQLGVENSITEHCYVYAKIPATKGFEKVPSIGFLAHLDTAGEVSGENVKPQIIQNYDCSTIKLNDTISININENPELQECKGHTIITSDGSTLLGADDKAGLSEIMTAVQLILKNESCKIEHGQIEILFSPDEETGHGMDNAPLSILQSKQCFTIDGGNLGEIEAECFNAYKSEIVFTGKALHTGSARPNMINAITMASSFLNMLPQNESPEATDEQQGFYAPMELSGNMESAKVSLLLRDFEESGMQRRILAIDTFAKAIEAKFHGGKTLVTHTLQYKNMKTVLDQNPQIMEKLINAVKEAGLEPNLKSIRGGTDGSRLTEQGIPTPNIFTGGHNFHSRQEWASLEQMCFSVKTIIELISIYAKS